MHTRAYDQLKLAWTRNVNITFTLVMRKLANQVCGAAAIFIRYLPVYRVRILQFEFRHINVTAGVEKSGTFLLRPSGVRDAYTNAIVWKSKSILIANSKLLLLQQMKIKQRNVAFKLIYKTARLLLRTVFPWQIDLICLPKKFTCGTQKCIVLLKGGRKRWKKKQKN